MIFLFCKILIINGVLLFCSPKDCMLKKVTSEYFAGLFFNVDYSFIFEL
jgi:hypothetical protein